MVPIDRKLVRMDTETLIDAINRAIGDELRGLRVKRKMTRDDLRAVTGLGYSTIQRSENGERALDTRELTLILQALDMPIMEFLSSALRDIEGAK